MGHVRVCGGSGWVTARFYPANSVFRQSRENPEKTLVESASVIFNALRQGIPKVFPVLSPALPTHWGGSSLAFAVGEEICERRKNCGSSLGLKAGVPCVLERSGGRGERRHGDGAVGKLMAFYAAKEDDAEGYQPMTYEAVETENRYRGNKDLWDD